jgi:predicted Zn-dependent protease
MQQYFYDLVDYAHTLLQGDEVLLSWFNGEDSDFIRFNQAKIRQAGSVAQRFLNLTLIEGQRQVDFSLSLSGLEEDDQVQIKAALQRLRNLLPHIPIDPFLNYARDGQSSETVGVDQLTDSYEIIDKILRAVDDKDFVGIYASGAMFTGFANSLGQRNWHSSYSFNVDWSFYHAADKAVKNSYAGFAWDDLDFLQKVSVASKQLSIIARPPRTIEPGQYRVYLAPAALQEIMGMLTEGGFSLKSQRSKQSPLLHLLEGSASLASSIHLKEYTAAGFSPAFQSEGYNKPNEVSLISAGKYQDALVSPRSAQEYGLACNGANGGEYPINLDMAAGQLAQAHVLRELDTGVYINNLWYVNFSDFAACRLTGMTRFATFWVENGEIIAPLNVMRFDDTIYNILGKNLRSLTLERELLLDTSTYGARSSASMHLPGALVEQFEFTL